MRVREFIATTLLLFALLKPGSPTFLSLHQQFFC
jgi:hypothetical protein